MFMYFKFMKNPNKMKKSGYKKQCEANLLSKPHGGKQKSDECLI